MEIIVANVSHADMVGEVHSTAWKEEVMVMGFALINEYIESLDDVRKKYVSDFENFMKIYFPELTPRISFALPMWWVGSKMYDGYVAISAAKEHYSIHFHDEYYILKLKEELPDCTFGRKCIKIKYGDEHTLSVVKRNVSEYLKSILPV